MAVTPDRDIALASDDALFVDFDGTRAGLQDNADNVSLVAGMEDVLVACAERVGGALAVLSGRDLDDLSKRVPSGLWRFGNHGLRRAAPNEIPAGTISAAPAELVAALQMLATRHPGVQLEPKGPVLAIHYRAAPDVQEALGQALKAAIAPFADYSVQHGKMVYEAKPSAANKGACLIDAMSSAPFQGRRPVMIGDDTTDEDAFSAAQSLGGFAVKVGEGPTVAHHRIASVAGVHTLLREFASS
jgi:trehalose 6-phosphate phosphatase